jgi:UDPglucose 6-dehydrogenase
MGLDDRIGRSFLDAGPGFGGSCLPEQAIALAALTGRADVPAPLVQAVATSNSVHQCAIVARLGALLGVSAGVEDQALRGRRIAVLGLAFKANTDDVRESPALAIVARLRAAGADVIGTDPVAGQRALAADPALKLADSPAAAAVGAHAVLIVTEWPAYRELDWAAVAQVMAGDLVFDTRRVADAAAVAAAGLRLVALGRP